MRKFIQHEIKLISRNLFPQIALSSNCQWRESIMYRTPKIERIYQTTLNEGWKRKNGNNFCFLFLLSQHKKENGKNLQTPYGLWGAIEILLALSVNIGMSRVCWGFCSSNWFRSFRSSLNACAFQAVQKLLTKNNDSMHRINFFSIQQTPAVSTRTFVWRSHTTVKRFSNPPRIKNK